MKTKRILSGLAALAMAGLMSITAFASEAPESWTINPKGGDPFDVTPNREKADTRVEFSIDPAYTVTIPQRVELAEGAEDVYTGTDEIIAKSVFLEPNKTIEVTLTSGSSFKLSHDTDSTVKLGYKAQAGEVTVTAANNGAVVATFGTSKEDQFRRITFTTTETPKYAGKYSDTVTFGLSVKTATNN